MTKRDKQRDVFLELVNKQLEPHGKCYEDVKGDPEWYMRYKTTHEQEQEFINWGVELLRTKLRMNKKMAQNEMSWFILQWGLTTNTAVEVNPLNEVAPKAKAIRKSAK
jgi:hypothetical protein